MKILKNKLISFVVVFTLICASWIWFSINQSLDNSLKIDLNEIDYSIKPGSSLSAVIYDLSNKNIIENPRYIIWYARLNGLSSKMKTGDYRLTSNLTVKEFLDNIFSGKVIQFSLTVIEGWSFKQLIKAINQHPHIKHTLKNLPENEIMDKLGLSGKHPEGLFLPDTYHFPKQLTDLEFLKRAYVSMQTVLKEEWGNRAVG